MQCQFHLRLVQHKVDAAVILLFGPCLIQLLSLLWQKKETTATGMTTTKGSKGRVKEEGYKEYSLQCLLQAGLIVAHASQNQMSQHHCLYKQACLCSVVPRLSCITCKMTSNPGYHHLDLVLDCFQ